MSDELIGKVATVYHVSFCKKFCKEYGTCGNLMNDQTKLVAPCVWDEIPVDEVLVQSKNWIDLEKGDKIVFTKVLSNQILVGKEYEVLYVDKDWKSAHPRCQPEFKFMCENGKIKCMQRKLYGHFAIIVGN